MIKTTVGEFRQFLAADLGKDDDGWFEDIAFYLNGSDDCIEDDECIFSDDMKTSLAPETVIRFSGGVLVFPQGSGREDLAIEPLFKKWRKEQTHMMVLVEIDKTRKDEFDAAIAAVGGKIVR